MKNNYVERHSPNQGDKLGKYSGDPSTIRIVHQKDKFDTEFIHLDRVTPMDSIDKREKEKA